MVGKMHSGKADQSTLASGGSKHAVSYKLQGGNKMDFSLCANMSGFCSRQSQFIIAKALNVAKAK